MKWTCMICGDERPDIHISVAHRPIPGLEDLFPESRCNVRFCNDRAACAEEARSDGPWTGIER